MLEEEEEDTTFLGKMGYKQTPFLNDEFAINLLDKHPSHYNQITEMTM